MEIFRYKRAGNADRHFKGNGQLFLLHAVVVSAFFPKINARIIP